MKRVRRTVYVFMAILLFGLFLYAADINRPGSVPAAGSNHPFNTKPDEKNTDPVTLKLFINYPYFVQSKWGDDLTSAEITGQTGVKLDIEIPADLEDGRSRINLMMSTNQYPDLIMTSKSELSRKLVASGALIPLDEYIEQYGPDIRKNVTMEYLRKYCSEADGKIYGLPDGMKQDSENTWMGPGVLVLNNLYRMLGSPDLKTIDDLYDYLAKVKTVGFQNYQGIEYTPCYMDWPPAALAVSYGVKLINVDGGAYVYGQDGLIRHALRDERIKEAYRFTNRLFRESLLDQDWFLQPQEEVYKKLLNGRIAVYFAYDAQSYMVEYGEQMKSISGDSYSLIPPPVVTGLKDKGSNYASCAPGMQIFVTSQCKEPVRAIQFLNWMASAKGQYTAWSGPEGTVWTTDAAGNPETIPGFSEKLHGDRAKANKEIGFMQWDFQKNYKYWKDSIFTLMTAREQRAFQERSAIIAQGLWNDPLLEPLFYSSGWDAEEVNSAMDVYISRAEKQIYMAGDDETFESLYNDTLAGVESLGLGTLEDELNRRIGHPDGIIEETDTDNSGG